MCFFYCVLCAFIHGSRAILANYGPPFPIWRVHLLATIKEWRRAFFISWLFLLVELGRVVIFLRYFFQHVVWMAEYIFRLALLSINFVNICGIFFSLTLIALFIRKIHLNFPIELEIVIVFEFSSTLHWINIVKLTFFVFHENIA